MTQGKNRDSGTIDHQVAANGSHERTVALAEGWRRNLGRLEPLALAGPRPAWWWTAGPPDSRAGLCEDGTLTSLPLPNLATCSRDDVLNYLANGWTLTEALFASLASEEGFYRPPYHNLRHPLIFYFCHPASLYVNKLRIAGLLPGPVNALYEHLFETGVDEMSWDDLSKNERLWPSLAEANAYRRQVYERVREILTTHPGLAPGHAPITSGDPLWAVFMGFEHERIHLETSSVLIRELPFELLQRPAAWPASHPSGAAGREVHLPVAGDDYPANPLAALPASAVHLGKPREWPTFGWDNEYGAKTMRVRPFQASQCMVSNGEFFEFVRAGGYREARYWSEAGWAWRTFRNAKWPPFWVPAGPAGLNQFALRDVFAVIPMPWSWPAEVSFYEAKAFCAWRTERDGGPALRLPTEAEHQRLRDRRLRDDQAGTSRDPVMALAGTAMAAECRQNLNLAFGSPSPVGTLGANSEGFCDVFGNAWEWCEDDFHPLPGFRVDPLYDDFSTPCFDGKHAIILGGSWVSTGDEASIWARFHFRPHFIQHAGFRLAASNDGDDTCDAVHLDDAGKLANVYESQQSLNEYMDLHFPPTPDPAIDKFCPPEALDFPARCARLVLDSAAAIGMKPRRALDIGCAVGRAVFELARGCDEVVGVDLSKTFIDAADALRRDGQLSYFRRDEGTIGATHIARIDKAIARTNTSFRQADACSLPGDLAGFDAVLLANLLCRLPSPRACLARMGGPLGLVRPGGLLVIVSPYTWMEQFTPPDVWLGGFERDGVAVRSADTLKSILAPEFELLSEADMPLVIREHARKYQYIVSHAMVWRRNLTEG